MVPNDVHPGAAPLIFISAAEQSADRHGASLIRATLARCPSARFVGVAGPQMVAAGCVSVFDMSRHSAMLLGAFRSVGRGIAMLRITDAHLRRHPFDAAVLIDSPTLHLPLASRAQAAGVPVLYYIAPQMWAWGAHRIYKLRHRTERVAVILPFEEVYFRNQGVDARFVGHPLAEQWAETHVDAGAVQRLRNAGHPVIALLPGSRTHVVESVLPGQLEVAEQVARALPGAAFGVSVANPQVTPVIEGLVADAAIEVAPNTESHAELIQAADLVLVASGTTALEVAFHRRPMIVMYNTSPVFYHLIGRWMIHTPHLSLPNILAGRRIVPEFMPYYRSTRPIAECALDLLRSSELRDRMIRDLDEVTTPLRGGRASERTAAMLLDMVRAHSH
jgi:lipid-A-disaccharide synthase